MTNKPFIPIILGTAREGRQSEQVAKYIFGVLRGRQDVEVQLVDVKDYIFGRTIPPWENNEITKPWREIAQRADGFIIVTPEYNHGYPGELKLLLDQELEAYKGKPVGLCGVSAGMLGGARAVEQLVQVVRELGMVALSYSLHFSKVKDFPKLSEKERDEQYHERANKLIQILLENLR